MISRLICAAIAASATAQIPDGTHTYRKNPAFGMDPRKFGVNYNPEFDDHFDVRGNDGHLGTKTIPNHGHYMYKNDVKHTAAEDHLIREYQIPRHQLNFVDTLEDETPYWVSNTVCECPEQALAHLKRDCATDACKHGHQPGICQNMEDLEKKFRAAVAASCSNGLCTELEVVLNDWVAHRPESRGKLFNPAETGHRLLKDEENHYVIKNGKKVYEQVFGEENVDHFDCKILYDEWHWNGWQKELADKKFDEVQHCGVGARQFDNGFPHGFHFCAEVDIGSGGTYKFSKVWPYEEMFDGKMVNGHETPNQEQRDLAKDAQLAKEIQKAHSGDYYDTITHRWEEIPGYSKTHHLHHEAAPLPAGAEPQLKKADIHRAQADMPK